MNTPTKEARAGIPNLQENELVQTSVVPEEQAVNQIDELPVPDALEHVRQYRLAARLAIRRESAPVKQRLLSLLDLMDAARGEKDALVRQWSERGIEEEAGDFVAFEKFPDEQPVTWGDPLARKHRQLRAEGYECCPKCYSRLLDEFDFARERRLWQAELERLAVREGAVR